MSGSDPSRWFGEVRVTSALYPRADIHRERRHVSKVPTTEVPLSITSLPRATWLRWSFGQPGLPQSFFQSRDVFGAPNRGQHVFKIGNT
jgi:hypothetical protein